LTNFVMPNCFSFDPLTDVEGDYTMLGRCGVLQAAMDSISPASNRGTNRGLKPSFV